MPYTVYLKKNEEKRILSGHPWVYANEVNKIEGKDKNGSLATVRDFSGRFIGRGFINHLSKILVRIISRNETEIIDKDFFKEKILTAKSVKEKLGFSCSYRVIFSESDNLPGLIVDKYDNVLCVQFLSLGMELNKEVIVDSLDEIFDPVCIYERSDADSRLKEGLQKVKGILKGKLPDKTVIDENGVKMVIDIENGQKTGYFLDQRENRFAIRRYAKGGSVLDCFCNSGGFSLNSAIGGAEKITACDISTLALDSVKENAILNGITNITTLEGDVFKILRDKKAEGEKYDLVILDPPAFCKSASEVVGAYKGYKDINTLGLKLVKSGGYLATCSCSHYITIPLFEKMLKEAARDSKRTVRLVEIKIQSPDHMSVIYEDESTYLKFFILNVL